MTKYTRQHLEATLINLSKQAEEEIKDAKTYTNFELVVEVQHFLKKLNCETFTQAEIDSILKP